MVERMRVVLLTFLLGVGKSAIGLLSFLNQFAQSRPIVYIPFGKNWVESGRTGKLPTPPLVRCYFIERFFNQNADLIEAHPVLADLFRSFFNDKPTDLATYMALVKALETGRVPQCSFIVDESQVCFVSLLF
jgi:hypothetical protein